ncbi:MAG: nucleotidyltransferase [Planctomycetes bacterium]|nr:nucleotidyltransferase [Planctomycetota bacterium]
MFLKLIARVAAKLDELGIDYMIIGGQAVMKHGEPRVTKDIDITLALDVSEANRIYAAMESLRLTSLAGNEDFVRKTMVLPAKDEESQIGIDFIFSTSALEHEAIKRASSFEIEGTAAKFISAEDLVIHKIVAGRARDIEDAKSVIAKQTKLDTKYVRRWLKELDSAMDTSFLASFESLLRKVSGK